MLVGLIQILRSVYPLVKEYFDNNLRNNKREHTWFIFLIIAVTLIWLSLLINFLSEQATKNLTLGKDMATQVTTLTKENSDLKIKLKSQRDRINDQEETIDRLMYEIEKGKK